MSTMRLTTILGAGITTTAIIFCYVLEALAHADLIPDPIELFLLSAGVIWWLGFLSAYVRDAINKHTDARANGILAAIASALKEVNTALEEVGDRRATAARIDTLAQMQDRANGHTGPHLVTR